MTDNSTPSQDPQQPKSKPVELLIADRGETPASFLARIREAQKRVMDAREQPPPQED